MRQARPNGEPTRIRRKSPGTAKTEGVVPESEKRARRAGVMLKYDEYERVARLAMKESRSVSSAIRLLILDALARQSGNG